jgi:hypothetical protein
MSELSTRWRLRTLPRQRIGSQWALRCAAFGFRISEKRQFTVARLTRVQDFTLIGRFVLKKVARLSLRSLGATEGKNFFWNWIADLIERNPPTPGSASATAGALRASTASPGTKSFLTNAVSSDGSTETASLPWSSALTGGARAHRGVPARSPRGGRSHAGVRRRLGARVVVEAPAGLAPVPARAEHLAQRRRLGEADDVPQAEHGDAGAQQSSSWP